MTECPPDGINTILFIIALGLTFTIGRLSMWNKCKEMLKEAKKET